MTTNNAQRVLAAGLHNRTLCHCSHHRKHTTRRSHSARVLEQGESPHNYAAKRRARQRQPVDPGTKNAGCAHAWRFAPEAGGVRGQGVSFLFLV